MSQRVHHVHVINGEIHTYDDVQILDSAWVSCRIRGVDEKQRDRWPPHMIEKIESETINEPVEVGDNE